MWDAIDLVIVNLLNHIVGMIVFSCFQHEVVVSEGDSSRILGIQGSFMFTSAKWL